MTQRRDVESVKIQKSGVKQSGPEADAKGQSEHNHRGGGNDGVSSANPRVFSGNESGDATFPLKRRKQTARG